MSKPTTYTPDYVQAMQAQQGAVLTPEQADALATRFAKTFNAMGRETLTLFVDDLYADALYFNDTLSIIREKPALLEYFTELSSKVTDFEVRVVNTLPAQNDVFLHWEMHYTLNFMGREQVIHSYGMSQLRANDEGKIVFHQDFWDGNNGLYRQLPYVNALFKRVVPLKTH